MRLIDADKTIKKAGCLFKDLNSTEDYMGIGYNHGVGDSIAIIKNAPTIEAEPVKHGRWIKNDDRSGWHCSCCGKDDLYAYPYTENNERELQDFYCPNCGAKMCTEEGEEE